MFLQIYITIICSILVYKFYFNNKLKFIIDNNIALLQYNRINGNILNNNAITILYYDLSEKSFNRLI